MFFKCLFNAEMFAGWSGGVITTMASVTHKIDAAVQAALNSHVFSLTLTLLLIFFCYKKVDDLWVKQTADSYPGDCCLFPI